VANFVTNAGSGGSTFASDTISTVEYPLAKSAWGAAGSVNQTSAANPFPTSKNSTIFAFSTANTSTAQLAAGASFTGTIEDAQNQPSISLLLTSDQPITLTVKQYIDLAGTRAVPDIVFYVGAGVGMSRSFTINGNYINVIATNTGASTTTTFSLNTAYGDLGDSESGGIQPVTELPLVLTGASAQTATVNNILTPTSGTAAVNVAGYRAASVQVNSTGTAGTYIFEQSNDNVNWTALPVFNAALVTAVPITAAVTASAANIVYTFPIRCVYLRLRIATTITGGSIQAFSRISTDPWTPSATLIGNNTAANVVVTANNATAANLAVTATQAVGTAATRWFAQISDGTNSPAVKAASTAVAATDPALTVGISPNMTVTASAINSAATTNATSVKASAGTVFSVTASNTGAAAAFVKLYNLAAAPTVGTSVPVITLSIPASGTVNVPFGPFGYRFATGIALAITNLAADTDTTAVAANQVKVLTSYN